MVIVHVTVDVKPEQRSAFVGMMNEFVADTLAVDACQTFSFYQQIQQENRFALYEEWDSAAAFDTYTCTERFTQFRDALGPMITAPPVSNRFEAQPL
ncbi:MAG: putative quinol monooxygenase [Chloroflexota bacterium]